MKVRQRFRISPLSWYSAVLCCYSGTGLNKLSVEPTRTLFPGTGEEGKPVSPLDLGRGEGHADDVAEPAALLMSKIPGESVREGRVEFGCC